MNGDANAPVISSKQGQTGVKMIKEIDMADMEHICRMMYVQPDKKLMKKAMNYLNGD